MPIFEREQQALAETEQADGEDRGQWHPEQDVDPPGRRGLELEDDGEGDDDAADDEDQEGRRPVADVEGGEIEPAGPAFGREACQAREQGAVAAARAEALERGGERGVGSVI